MTFTRIKTTYFYGLIFVLLLIYVIYRAYSLGITYDESWTIRSFVDLTFMDILSCSPCDANNHIFNTLLIKLLFGFGSDALFVARIPSIFAFLLYGYFGYKICAEYLSPWIGICVFLLITANPFVLDFFSLARGYGLALGFQMMSLYYLIHFFKSTKTKYAVYSLLGGVFMVMSSFSFLNYWLVIAFVFTLYSLVFRAQINLKQILISFFLIGFLLLALIYEPLRKMLVNGNFYYGGEVGFYSDTLVSLTKYSMYSSVESSLVFWVLNALLIVSFLAVLLSLFQNYRIKSPKMLLLLTFMLCVYAIIAQHYLFDTPFVIDRTALFFYPLLIFLLGFALYDLLKKHWVYNLVVGIIMLLFVFNFVSHANTYKTATWYFDAHTRDILSIMNERGKAKGAPIKIDYSWPFESSMQYYTEKNNYDYLEIVKASWNREVYNDSADYYIFLNHGLEKVGYAIEHQKIIDATKIVDMVFESEHIIIYSISKQE